MDTKVDIRHLWLSIYKALLRGSKYVYFLLQLEAGEQNVSVTVAVTCDHLEEIFSKPKIYEIDTNNSQYDIEAYCNQTNPNR